MRLQHNERAELAQRFAPILKLYPEIPAGESSDAGLRDRYTRQRMHTSTRRFTGEHITRDFHPRGVELILADASGYQISKLLPFIPIAFARAYRDNAHLFFFPLLLVVLAVLVLVAFAQPLDPVGRDLINLMGFGLILVLFVATFRSPIHAPTNRWHLLNQFVMGVGLAVIYRLQVGLIDTTAEWVLFLFFAVPGLPIVYAWVYYLFGATLRAVASGIGNGFRRVARRQRSAPDSPNEDLYRRAFRKKPLHQYRADAELFFKRPGTNRALDRSDRAAHWTAYSELISNASYPKTCYARVLDPDDEGIVVIQYWYCYYYDDWANDHEGDWEMACVLLKDGEPVGVAASQHEGGEYREWDEVETDDGDRPILYVAVGSHALYFAPGAYATHRTVFGLRVSALDVANVGGDVLEYVDHTPRDDEAELVDDMIVVTIPDPSERTGLWGHTDHLGECTYPCPHDLRWLNFPGHWGAAAFGPGGSSGPKGPADAGLRWDDPNMWVQLACKNTPD